MRASRFYGSCSDCASYKPLYGHHCQHQCFSRGDNGTNSSSGAPPEQLPCKLPRAKQVQKTLSVTAAKSSRFPQSLWGYKKLSFSAQILLHVILSSNAHIVAGGCYFWQKSSFSDDTTGTPKGTISDREMFPWAFALLQKEASDGAPSLGQALFL